MGIDPGLAKFGYAVCALTEDGIEVLNMGLLETQKSDKKRKVLASDDNFRRGQELTRGLIKVMEAADGTFCAFCAESMSYPRNSSAAAKMAISWGVICCISEQQKISVLQQSPQAVKKFLCDTGNASKKDVQEAVCRSLGDRIPPLVDHLPKSKREHPYDGLAVVLACSDSETLRMARRMAAL